MGKPLLYSERTMRHFKLVNDIKEVFDITTKEALFHEIDGLGFEEENVFNRIGSVWWLSHTEYRQGVISGKMIFTEENGKDPYSTYQEFVRFISYPPLTLLYNPFGPVRSPMCGDSEDEEAAYYRTVRVSKLEKSEKNEYGVIDSSIDFATYTPWYRIENYLINDTPPDDGSADTGWIWGDDASNPPLTFEPTGSQTATRARFRWEPVQSLSFKVDASGTSPAVLTIHGPLVNPTWTHVLIRGDNSTIFLGSGSFTNDITLEDGDLLVIDANPSKYSIEWIHANGTVTDLYPYRNFEETCFINLRAGMNRVSVRSSNGDICSHFDLEGYIYNATV